MKKPLKTYFDSAKEAPSLLNSSEIRNLVESPQQGVLKNEKKFLKRGWTPMNNLTMSLIIMLGIFALFFKNDDAQTEVIPKATPSPKSVPEQTSNFKKHKYAITQSTFDSLKKSDSSQHKPLQAEYRGQNVASNSKLIEPTVSGKPDLLHPVNSSILQTDSSRILQAENSSILQTENPRTLNNDVAGIKILDLSKEEFLKLGVRVEDKKVVYYKKTFFDVEKLKWYHKLALMFYGIDANDPQYIATVVVTMNGVSNGAKASEDDYKDVGIVPVAPRVSTNYYNGKLMAMTWQDGDSVYSEMVTENARNLGTARSVNAMIPIRTVLKDPQAEYFKETDVILWYEVTPELLALLPDRFKKPLIEEIAAAEDPDQPIISGEKFFDTWRTNAGAISRTAVYPNPVRDSRATLDFSLNEERHISIVLHDIFGKKIVELQSPQLTPAGTYKWELVLKDVASGMYLISVQTDHGEQAVQRIIVD